MNTNMTGFRCFSRIFASLCFGQKQPQHWEGYNVLEALSYRITAHKASIGFAAIWRLKGHDVHFCFVLAVLVVAPLLVRHGPVLLLPAGEDQVDDGATSVERRADVPHWLPRRLCTLK